MNRELLLKAFGDIDEGFIAEAYRPLPEAAAWLSPRLEDLRISSHPINSQAAT